MRADPRNPRRAVQQAGRALRSLLVFAGVLPERDEHLAALRRWTTAKLAGIDAREELLVLRAFITWHCLPRLHRRLRSAPASSVQITLVRDRITIATDFLTWLRARGQALLDVGQADIDEWLTTGKTTRYDLREFLRWAVRNGYVGDVIIPHRTSHRHTPPVDADQRWTMARNLLHNNDIAIPYRAAGLLLLLYAQPMTKIIQLQVAHVLQADAGVYLSLGSTPMHLPDPLDELVIRLVEEHVGHSAHGRGERSPWLFPGARPGRHISYIQMATGLHDLDIHALPSRAAALLDLCAQLPADIISQLLGLSTSSADAWSHGGAQAGYATEVARRATGNRTPGNDRLG
ncbi:hypothetical protein ACFWVM_01260 [Nocardia fluminea]|uniref:hypothetical protein n=1 Tax=Nocardia fluminea TaxID=134984 RepID=UPI00364A5A14